MASLDLPITVAQAKELTGRIKRSAEATWKLLEEAYTRKAWEPLGYKSWKAYAAAEFGMSERNAYRLIDQGQVAKALKEAAGPTVARVSPSARQAARIKPHLPEATAEVTQRVEAGEAPERVVPEVIQTYGAPPKIEGAGAPVPSAEEPDQGAPASPGSDSSTGTGNRRLFTGATDPKKGQGDEGAEVEGDVGAATARVPDDGPVGQDHGDSASEPSPMASKGPGGVSGVAAVAVPEPSGSPTFTVRLAIEFLLETPDFEVDATVEDLRMLAAWCHRNLAARGFEDPHERCRQHLAHLQQLLDEARRTAA